MSLPLRGAVESTWMGEALGIELASRNKLNDLGCVRGLQNLSSLMAPNAGNPVSERVVCESW
jgi:hypothetical protein